MVRRHISSDEMQSLITKQTSATIHISLYKFRNIYRYSSIQTDPFLANQINDKGLLSNDHSYPRAFYDYNTANSWLLPNGTPLL
jgi:hypothetical protein